LVSLERPLTNGEVNLLTVYTEPFLIALAKVGCIPGSIFVITLLLLIFAYASLNSRFFNIGKFTSISIFGTLVVWGIFFVLYKFTGGGVISPELSILLPMLLWVTISIYFYNKKINS
jgi:lipopolysaccharide export LptBFGC system permease protein LptF